MSCGTCSETRREVFSCLLHRLQLPHTPLSSLTSHRRQDKITTERERERGGDEEEEEEDEHSKLLANLV